MTIKTDYKQILEARTIKKKTAINKIAFTTGINTLNVFNNKQSIRTEWTKPIYN